MILKKKNIYKNDKYRTGILPDLIVVQHNLYGPFLKFTPCNVESLDELVKHRLAS